MALFFLIIFLVNYMQLRLHFFSRLSNFMKNGLMDYPRFWLLSKFKSLFSLSPHFLHIECYFLLMYPLCEYHLVFLIIFKTDSSFGVDGFKIDIGLPRPRPPLIGEHILQFYLHPIFFLDNWTIQFDNLGLLLFLDLLFH